MIFRKSPPLQVPQFHQCKMRRGSACLSGKAAMLPQELRLGSWWSLFSGLSFILFFHPLLPHTVTDIYNLAARVLGQSPHPPLSLHSRVLVIWPLNKSAPVSANFLIYKIGDHIYLTRSWWREDGEREQTGVYLPESLTLGKEPCLPRARAPSQCQWPTGHS